MSCVFDFTCFSSVPRLKVLLGMGLFSVFCSNRFFSGGSVVVPFLSDFIIPDSFSVF